MMRMMSVVDFDRQDFDRQDGGVWPHRSLHVASLSGDFHRGIEKARARDAHGKQLPRGRLQPFVRCMQLVHEEGEGGGRRKQAPARLANRPVQTVCTLRSEVV